MMDTNPIYNQMARTLGSTSVLVCLIGDSAFPLSNHLMKPYPESYKIPEQQRYFNFCLSRARRVVENASGRLKARFRVLNILEVELHNTVLIIEACCILNNVC